MSSAPAMIRRRDGTLVPFDRARISDAVRRAGLEVGRADPALVDKVTRRVTDDLAAAFGRRAPGVEQVQDTVERALMAGGFEDVARAYIVYRRRRAEERETKRVLGVRDELKLGVPAVSVLAERYLRRDERGRISESTGEMMDRVARHVAAVEDGYRPGSSEEWAEHFSAMLRSLEFLPNSPTLMNAGTELGVLSGCFVLPLEDSLDSIFTTMRHAALIHQAGGGTGFSFSRLRPAGDHVASSGGSASGPLSFLELFDAASEVVRLGGRRRSANMAVLDVSHPDIEAFVAAKDDSDERLATFNLSVGVTDRFMRAAREGGEHKLRNPRTGRVVRRMDARDLFDQIAVHAWRCGDPGLLFLDTVNRANPLPGRGRIEATNPCGEVPLLPYESCNLGSLNLARFLRDGALDEDRLVATVRLAVRFLDDVIDAARYPAPDFEQAALATRKVGLGVMGLAETLAALGLPYDSEDAVRLAGRVAHLIRRGAYACSAELAAERGAFPLFGESIFARRGRPPMRNAQLTSVAPTGTISLIARTTSGIEPLFALVFTRDVLGTRLLEINPLFERLARRGGFWSDALMADIARTGTVRDQPGVPADVRRAFVTALEVAPEWHVRMQAAVQRHVDAAVSKTVNLPADAAIDDVAAVYFSAWQARAKGITVYRYGSRAGQVLRLGQEDAAAAVQVHHSYSGGCAGRLCEF